MRIGILMTTYAPGSPEGYVRAINAGKALMSWQDHLLAPGYEFHLHIADDGSPPEWAFDHRGTMRDWDWSYSRQDARGVGASLNAGLVTLFGEGIGLVLYAVDDWMLMADFDLGEWADLLATDDRFGCIRLGPPHPNLRGSVEHFPATEGHPSKWGLVLESYGYVAAQRPALWHRRMFDALGWWKEDCSALECEADFNHRWQQFDAPKILLALPHPWQHLDGIELGECQPGERP